MKRINKALFVTLTILFVGVLFVLLKCSGITVTTRVDNSIDSTPIQIQKIKSIGEWEFLSIEDEELVDTVKREIFSSKRLARIYRGTLRLGIHMRKLKDNAITAHKDTLIATMPPVRLLSTDYIDEAATQTVFEKGTWSQQERKDLLAVAYRQMARRCLTKANYQAARTNALSQLETFFKNMGFRHVKISFEESTYSPL